MADDFDLSSLISPMRAAGLDSNDPRALALFAKMQGGGVGVPGAPDAAAPPVAPAASAQPVGVPPGSTPAPAPVLTGRPIAKPVVPGTVTPSGESQGTADDLAAQARSETALQEAQAKRAQDLRDPATGKLLQEYRPSIGQRIVRGLEGFARGGVRGALDAKYGAPNQAGQQELRREDSDIAMGQQSLAEQARRFKERQEAARADRLEAQANQPPKQTPEKPERVVDAAGHVHYVTPSQIEQSGQYFDPSTYNKENAPDRVPTTYEQTVIAAENEKEPNGPLHRGAQRMIDTEKKKFQAANPGRQPTDMELWNQAFQSEYGRKPNAEEIASRKVAGGGTAGGAAARPVSDAGNRAKLTAIEKEKDIALRQGTDKYKFDGTNWVNRKDAEDTMTPAEWRQSRQDIQDAYENKRATETGQEQGHVTLDKDGNYPPAAAPAATPAAPTSAAPQRPAPQNNQQPKIPTKADSPSASEGRRNPKTGEEAYKINGKWYKASELK